MIDLRMTETMAYVFFALLMGASFVTGLWLKAKQPPHEKNAE